MSDVTITPYRPEHRDRVVDLAIGAWDPVFAKTHNEVPRFVYEAFYPAGWQVRQRADVGQLLDSEGQNVWLAFVGGDLAGFVGIRLHPGDRMGEIHILAVAPERQRRGIGRALMAFAERHIGASGMQMVMVETVGDSGHEPARRAYEARGYERWPVARYFKPL